MYQNAFYVFFPLDFSPWRVGLGSSCRSVNYLLLLKCMMNRAMMFSVANCTGNMGLQYMSLRGRACVLPGSADSGPP